MKKLFVVGAFLILLFAAGMFYKDFTAPVSEGIEPAKDVMETLGKRSDELWFEKMREGHGKNAKYIIETIDKMSLDEKLSQMIILTNPKDITPANMSEYKPGGIIYFSLDFNGKTVEQVKNKTDELQANVEIPLLVGVDEEGGDVSRISGLRDMNLPDSMSARLLWKDQNEEVLRSDTEEKIQFLKQMGINLNFNPVADVSDSKTAYMYNRSAGDDGETVSVYVKEVLDVMQKEDMASCIKHFPGYGNNANTHMFYVEDGRKLSEYQEKDFLPFEMGIEQGTDMIMVSHIVMKSVDDRNPASLSGEVHNILREDLGYEGVIISDDLNMKAILSKMTMETASAQAVLAGNDMIFSADYKASLAGLKKIVDEGLLKEDRIDESVARILEMKIRRHIIDVE